MSIFLQVVAVHTVDATPCLCFWTDSKRFLINAGEGTQRMCVEHKIKIRKVEHVLLTDLNIRSIGGLPGLCLTAADAGRNRLSITAPEGLAAFMSSAENFMRRTGLEIVGNEAQAILWHHYDDVKIGCIPFTPPGTPKRSHDNEAPRHVDKSVCYLFETPPVVGKFDAKKAKAMGIPPGPSYGKLKAGQDVTLENGRTILAAELMPETTPGRICICIPNVSIECAADLIAMPVWQSYYKNGDEGVKVDCMVHLSSVETVKSTPYLEWMAQFAPETVHLMCGIGCCNPISPYRAAAIQTRKLFTVAPQYFVPVSLTQPAVPDVFQHDQLHVVPAAPLMRMHVVPLKKKGVDSTCIVDKNIDEDAQLLPALEEQVQKLKQEADANMPTQMDTPGSCQIIFLGTGCAVPAKTRNVSAIALHTESDNLMLLDAGEGSWGQLYKRTQASAPQEPVTYSQIALSLARRVRAIWISHPHADHHLGLLRILNERKQAFATVHGAYAKRPRKDSVPPVDVTSQEGSMEISAEARKSRYQHARTAALQELLDTEHHDHFFPCVVIAPPSVLKFLRAYQNIEPGFENTFIGFSSFEFDPQALESHPSSVEESLLFEYLQKCFGINELINVRVEHCSQAFGLAVTAADRWKIVYSGDCRPSKSLIECGLNATVLIHEATFEDEQHEEAVAKKHCTCGEAIDVGKRMRARTVILTHFSQRNPTLPAIATDSAVCIAFDFMSLRLDGLAWAPAFMPALRLVTAREDDENDDTAKEEHK